jgi:hypothetical protein
MVIGDVLVVGIWYSDSDILQFPQVAFLVKKRGFSAFQTPNRRFRFSLTKSS